VRAAVHGNHIEIEGTPARRVETPRKKKKKRRKSRPRPRLRKGSASLSRRSPPRTWGGDYETSAWKELVERITRAGPRSTSTRNPARNARNPLHARGPGEIVWVAGPPSRRTLNRLGSAAARGKTPASCFERGIPPAEPARLRPTCRFDQLPRQAPRAASPRSFRHRGTRAHERWFTESSSDYEPTSSQVPREAGRRPLIAFPRRHDLQLPPARPPLVPRAAIATPDVLPRGPLPGSANPYLVRT